MHRNALGGFEGGGDFRRRAVGGDGEGDVFRVGGADHDEFRDAGAAFAGQLPEARQEARATVAEADGQDQIVRGGAEGIDDFAGDLGIAAFPGLHLASAVFGSDGQRKISFGDLFVEARRAGFHVGHQLQIGAEPPEFPLVGRQDVLRGEDDAGNARRLGRMGDGEPLVAAGGHDHLRGAGLERFGDGGRSDAVLVGARRAMDLGLEMDLGVELLRERRAEHGWTNGRGHGTPRKRNRFQKAGEYASGAGDGNTGEKKDSGVSIQDSE